MEISNYTIDDGSPPQPGSLGYELLNKEMAHQNNPNRKIQSTVVTIVPEVLPIRDHIVWSVFSAIYLNMCCLGVLALLYSVKSRDRKLLADQNGAYKFGSTAQALNIAATVTSILSIIAILFFYFFL